LVLTRNLFSRMFHPASMYEGYCNVYVRMNQQTLI